MYEQIKAFFPLIIKKRHVTYGTFPGTLLLKKKKKQKNKKQKKMNMAVKANVLV